MEQDGRFQAEAFLSPGDNIIQVLAFDSEGNQEAFELTVTSLALPPQPFMLFITEPEDQSIVSDSSVRLAGRTAPDAEVRVNGVEIPVDVLLGIFSTKVALDPGPNVINVSASIRDGQVINRVIAVIFRPPPER